MRFVAGDLFLELVDELFDRAKGYLAQALVATLLLSPGVIMSFKVRELAPRVGELDVVLKTHGITSIMPFGTASRSLENVASTMALKSGSSTT